MLNNNYLLAAVQSICLASSVSWVRIPPEQLFFLFGEKGVVWISCLALFSIHTVGLRVFMFFIIIIIPQLSWNSYSPYLEHLRNDCYLEIRIYYNI